MSSFQTWLGIPYAGVTRMADDVILLPGMGADARLFQLQEEAISFSVPPWPEPLSGDSLPAFAARLVSGLNGTPSIVGGASFGGMVALEVAALVRPRAVALIGSCAAPSSLAPYVRALGSLVVRLPNAAFRPRRAVSPLMLPKFGQLDRSQRALFWRMAGSVSASFLKWACSAVLSWRPTIHHVPVFHIHGDRDRLIPIQRVQPTDVVAGGGHLLSLSHPNEVNAFLKRIASTIA